MKKKDACEVSSYVHHGRVFYSLRLKANTLKKLARPEESSLLDPCSYGYIEQRYHDYDGAYIIMNWFWVYVDKNNLLHWWDLEWGYWDLVISSSHRKLYLKRQNLKCIGYHEEGNYYDNQQEDESDAQYGKRIRESLNEYMKDQWEDKLYSQVYECRLVDNK